MSYYGTYQWFGVPAFASRLTLPRAAVRVLTPECRRNPGKRGRAMLSTANVSNTSSRIRRSASATAPDPPVVLLPRRG
jgi:hypothetical protein